MFSSQPYICFCKKLIRSELQKQNNTTQLLPCSFKATSSVTSSSIVNSPTCWWGGPTGIIAPPCKYSAGKSYIKQNRINRKSGKKRILSRHNNKAYQHVQKYIRDVHHRNQNASKFLLAMCTAKYPSPDQPQCWSWKIGCQNKIPGSKSE